MTPEDQQIVDNWEKNKDYSFWNMKRKSFLDIVFFMSDSKWTDFSDFYNPDYFSPE